MSTIRETLSRYCEFALQEIDGTVGVDLEIIEKYVTVGEYQYDPRGAA